MTADEQKVTSAGLVLTPELQREISKALIDCIAIAEQAFPCLESSAGAATDRQSIRAGSQGQELWGRLALLRLGTWCGGQAWASVLDYLRAAAHDVRRTDPVPSWSTTALIRSALEAEATFAYLFKREPALKRAARAAAVLLGDVPYVEKVAKQAGEVQAEAERAIRGLRRIVEHAGIQSTIDKNNKAELRIGTMKVSAELGFANMVSGFWPKEIGSPYDILSGASHSRPWVLSAGGQNGPAALNSLVTGSQILQTWLTLADAYTGTDLTSAAQQIGNRTAMAIVQVLEARV
ncbi:MULTISPECIES: hypothetical protein [unclassified Streptomyces]|uniref:hypothetical protein n=1 Tax=unclassified Streptomyces TaxID=2593676 RepID=UPI002259AF6C|nr:MULTISPECIES: hypothetical protein [unclassified Streptomyces]MCX5140096.1 hypothetical protein [Streptomyces sp. NBC_00338]WRZ64697.1 hypothetical protein OG408_12710 [Streptomyces sp. NBC_01257]